MPRGALSLLLYAGLLFVAASTAKTDLVDRRRSFRPWFLVTMALLGLGITLFELAGLDQTLPLQGYLLQSGAFLGLASAFGAWALRARVGLWAAPRPADPAEKPLDTSLITRLEAKMAEKI
ncbi:hypothetical protein [Halovulum sp. GXIMD14793]